MAAPYPAGGGEWFKDSTIGQGGFGTVSLWKNNSTAQCIAMKECKFGKQMSEQNRQRWHKEIQIMKKLDHPNVVRAMDLPDGIPVSKQDLPPLVLEFCEKGDLRKVLRRPENSCGLEETKVRDIMRDVGAAVEYLHKNKIIHRDLKPENVLMKEEDNRIVYKLTDLGYAKDLDRESICHSFVGTMQYLAPELFEQVQYSCTVDYWSFGMIIFECITGVRPFNIQAGNNVHWVQRVMTKKDDQICLDPLTGNFSQNIPDPNHLCKLSRICFEKWIRVMLIRNPKLRGQGIDQTSKRPMCFKIMENLLSLKQVSVYCASTNTLYTENLSPDDGSGAPDLTAHKDPSGGSPPIHVPVADLIFHQTRIPVKQQMYLLEDGRQVPNSELYKYENAMIYMFDTHQAQPLHWKPISRLPLVEQLLTTKKMAPLEQKRAWSHVVFYCHRIYEHFTYMMKACLAALTRLLNLRQACSDIGEEVTEVAIRLHAQANLLLTSIEGDKQYRQSLGKATGLDDYIAYATNTGAELSRLAEQAENFTSPIKPGKAEASVDDLKFTYKHTICRIPQKFSSRKSEATAMYDRLRAALRENKQLMNDDMVKVLKNCIQDERSLSKEMTDFLHRRLHNSGLYKDLKDRQQHLQASQRQLKQLQDELGQLHQDYQRFKWGQVQELAESSHGNQLMNGEVEPPPHLQPPPDVVSLMAAGDDDLCSLLKQSDLDDVHSILADNVSLRETMSSLMMPN